MKIAILHSGDLNTVSRGGVDRYIKSIISFCDDYEITVFGVTVTGEHRIGNQYEKEFCGKKYYFVPIIDDRKYPLSIRYMIKEFLWINKLGKYDCIYAQRTEYSIPFFFSKHKHRLIEMIHGSSKYSEVFWGKHKARLHLFFEKIAIGTAAKTYIILNRDEYGVPYYKRRYPHYADKIEYGLNPIDTRVYCAKDKNDTRRKLGITYEKVILFAGRVEDNPKRVLLFPDIMKRVVEKYPSAGFVVVGDGQDLDLLKKNVEEKGLRNCFAFTGYIDDPYTISKYNSAADVSLNISMFEGTCTSNLESIACGTPVVSTDVGDIHECISTDSNGIIIPNSDDESIIRNCTDAITSIFENGIKMNKIYVKYDGRGVAAKMKKEIENYCH